VSPEPDPSERIRTLLLRGDNVLKKSGDGGERLQRALEAFKEAEELSADETVDPRVRDLVARRIASVRGLIEGGE
jgi:hypothetical protein